MATRAQVVEAGTKLLAAEGNAGLSARRIATEIDASTMAVYTHFDGMDGLRRAIRDHGFAILREAWGSVEQTEDPVADLTVFGMRYLLFGLSNPNLYRSMFFESTSSGEIRPDLMGAAVDFPRRCFEHGRFTHGEPEEAMWLLWTATHGLTAALLSGIVELDEVEARTRFLGMTLYTGFGDEREAAVRSLSQARLRLEGV